MMPLRLFHRLKELVGTIPRDPKTVQADVERLAEKIVVPAARF
jgi:hypothetical protein